MLKILDTTLRDGSYVIDFNFTQQQTYKIASCLDNVGIHYIEIGHGLGLNATKHKDMKGACSDEAWLEAGSAAVKKNKWGMFFIPGIGTLDDIDLAAKYNMDFIRIGANVNEYERAEPYIRRAKEKGMFVCANFMKTYAKSYESVGKIAAKASLFGADLNCIVDSAGAMMPEDLEGYVQAIRNHTDSLIGFHGHNNLGMANSLSLEAARLGVDVIDTSVRGMGRSAGNTVTEIFILSLLRKGIDLGFDIYAILDIAEELIDPLIKGYKQTDSYSILCGYSKFHSSFMPRVKKIADEYQVDMRKLIVAICTVDCIDAPEDLIRRKAQELL